LVRASD